MLLQNLRAKVGARLNGDKEAGFTLIELLVVMLILGILAAIALPAFFNQRDKAGDSKAKENAHTAQVAIETYATEHSGSYAGVDLAKLHAIEPEISTTEGKEKATGQDPVEGIFLSNIGEKSYTINSVSSGGNVFRIGNSAGTLTFTCKAPGSGGCPAAAKDGSGNSLPEADWSK